MEERGPVAYSGARRRCGSGGGGVAALAVVSVGGDLSWRQWSRTRSGAASVAVGDDGGRRGEGDGARVSYDSDEGWRFSCNSQRGNRR